MPICGQWALIKYEDRTFTVIPLQCRGWDCPDCAPRQRRRFLRALEDTSVDSLLTLTCRPDWYKRPEDAFKSMSRAIPHLIKRLKRSLPRMNLQYLVVWEETRQGWPHAHVLLRGPYIPQRLLSRHWCALTGAPIVDIRRVNQIAEAKAYVSKYLAKQPRVPPGFRRFRSSAAFWKAGAPNHHTPREGPSPWGLRRDPVNYVAQSFAGLGFTVTFVTPYTFTARYIRGPPLYTFQQLQGHTIPFPAH